MHVGDHVSKMFTTRMHARHVIVSMLRDVDLAWSAATDLWLPLTELIALCSQAE